ncbi:MAG: flagellar protein FlaG [Nitrospirae bacterium]|nr:flagellar protein FlaG [Nitrospirota bacterium]
MEVNSSTNLSSLSAYNPTAANFAKQAANLSNSQAQAQVQVQVQAKAQNGSAGLGAANQNSSPQNLSQTVAGNVAVQEAQKNIQNKLVESAKNITKSASKVVFEYNKITGDSVVKYMDAKGNVVTQVPPEQYLKMKEILGDSNSLNIEEVSADAKDMKETGVILSKKV